MRPTQYEAALAAMTAWLSHPQELGHEPAEIECTGTFVLHDMTYYIFKYKDTKDSEWLLGVNGGGCEWWIRRRQLVGLRPYLQ